ncbi:hypothetical protein CS542_08965 [Pedobacter sp. IW39]|nr:hypothetical protein CS542_08965 [Pedobacter sp. IW39]
MELEKYIIGAKLEDSSALRLRNFYNSRNFQFAWLTEKDWQNKPGYFMHWIKVMIRLQRQL